MKKLLIPTYGTVRYGTVIYSTTSKWYHRSVRFIGRTYVSLLVPVQYVKCTIAEKEERIGFLRISFTVGTYML